MAELVRSVGLGLAARGDVDDAVTWAQRAEDLGLESVWVHDPYFERDPVSFLAPMARAGVVGYKCFLAETVGAMRVVVSGLTPDERVVVAGILDEGLSAAAAVERPRFHPAPDVVNAEPGVDEAALEQIEERGLAVRRWPERHHYFGGVSVVSRAGTAGDLRRDGAAADQDGGPRLYGRGEAEDSGRPRQCPYVDRTSDMTYCRIMYLACVCSEPTPPP